MVNFLLKLQVCEGLEGFVFGYGTKRVCSKLDSLLRRDEKLLFELRTDKTKQQGKMQQVLEFALFMMRMILIL